jgi:hypothetical protein
VEKSRLETALLANDDEETASRRAMIRSQVDCESSTRMPSLADEDQMDTRHTSRFLSFGHCFSFFAPRHSLPVLESTHQPRPLSDIVSTTYDYASEVGVTILIPVVVVEYLRSTVL